MSSFSSDSDLTGLYRTATDWLARRHAASWDDAQARALQAWLDADPRHAQAYRQVTGARDTLGSPAAEGAPAGSGPVGTGARQRRAGSLGRWLVWGGLAVSLLLVLALTISFVLRDSTPRFSERAPAGAQVREWRLPDGSSVTLDGGTDAAARLFSRRREVTLSQGQALFRVAYQYRAGFTVHAGAEDIGIDGGQLPVPDVVFDVQSTPAVLRVRVAAGTVKVYTVTAGAREFVELSAGQALAVHRDARRHERGSIAPQEVGGWRPGRDTSGSVPAGAPMQ